MHCNIIREEHNKQEKHIYKEMLFHIILFIHFFMQSQQSLIWLTLVQYLLCLLHCFVVYFYSFFIFLHTLAAIKKFFFLNLFIVLKQLRLVFSKDALNCSKGTVKSILKTVF